MGGVDSWLWVNTGLRRWTATFKIHKYDYSCDLLIVITNTYVHARLHLGNKVKYIINKFRRMVITIQNTVKSYPLC